MKKDDIAIIGMACEFPNSSCIDEYWNHLLNNDSCLTSFDKSLLLNSGNELSQVADSDYIPVKGLPYDVNQFDKDFFGYNQYEVERMSPQLKMMYSCVWHALEHAGYENKREFHKIAFVATASADYEWHEYVKKHTTEDKFSLEILAERDFIASHIGYKLGFRGPCIMINSGCSSSLVAVNQAIKMLNDEQIDIVVVGGVSISYPFVKGYVYQEGMIGARDGRCCPFDKDATGTVEGNGCGVIVLRRCQDALLANDNILAIIKGSYVNNDGNRKIGFVAPSPNGIGEAIEKVHDLSGIDKNDIVYIEAHGTGTKLGDMVELDALQKVYSKTNKKVYLGSVKANIGHLDVCAGMASIIKCVLILKNRIIPPLHNIKVETEYLNQEIFVLNRKRVDLSDQEHLCIGINSLGIGGNNGYIILENFDNCLNGETFKVYDNSNEDSKLFFISAMKKKSLDTLKQKYVEYVSEKKTNLQMLTNTLLINKPKYKLFIWFEYKTIEELLNKLEDARVNEVLEQEGDFFVDCSGLLDIEDDVFKKVIASKWHNKIPLESKEDFVSLVFVCLKMLGLDDKKIIGNKGTCDSSRSGSEMEYRINADIVQNVNMLITEFGGVVCYENSIKMILNMYQICMVAYKNRVNIKWNLLALEDRFIFNLPEYPFDKKEYSFSDVGAAKLELTKKTEKFEDWFYTPIWTAEKLISQSKSGINERYKCILFVSSGCDILHIENYISEDELECRIVYIDSISDNNALMVIYRNKLYTLVNLLLFFRDEGYIPEKYIYFGAIKETGIDSYDDFIEYVDKNFIPLIQLIVSVDSIYINTQKELALVISSTCAVLEEENIHPEISPFLSICNSLGHESGFCGYTIFDIEESAFTKEYYKDIFSMICKQMRGQYYAYRRGSKWSLRYEKIETVSSNSDEERVFLLFGGLGNIGLLLVKKIIQLYPKCKIVIATRQMIPTGNMRMHWFKNSKNEKLLNKLKKLESIKYKKTQDISVRRANICSASDVNNIIADTIIQYGKIDYLVNLAGIVGMESWTYIEDINLEQCKKVFEPKIKGALNIADAIENRDVRNVILMSSLASILGGVGQSVYNAANIFCDIFVKKKNREKNSIRWHSLLLETVMNAQIEKHHILKKYAMSEAEASDVIINALTQKEYDNIVISSGELSERIDFFDKINSFEKNNEYLVKSAKELKKDICKIWNDFLGVEVNERMNFFDVGGDSLKAIQMICLIRDKYNVRIRLIDFYRNPTINGFLRQIKDSVTMETKVLENVKLFKSYYPVTYTQYSMLKEKKYDYYGRYNLGCLVKIKCNVEHQRLETALNKLVERHEILRAKFRLSNDQYTFAIQEQMDVKLDYYECDACEFERIRVNLIEEFDINNGPLFRFKLFHVDVDYILFIDLHHAIFDEASVNIILRDIKDLYDGKCLRKLEYQFTDYAEYVYQELRGKALINGQNFWLKMFQSKQCYQLVGDKNDEKKVLEYDASILDTQLLLLCQKYSITRFMLIVAIILIVLNEIQNHMDIVIAFRLSTRHNVDFSDVVGCFLEKVSVVFRKYENNIEEYLDYVKKQMSEAIENVLFYSELVKSNHITDNMTNILINYMVVDQSNKTIERESVLKKINSKYDINMRIFDYGKELKFSLKYNAGLFSIEYLDTFFHKIQETLKKLT